MVRQVGGNRRTRSVSQRPWRGCNTTAPLGQHTLYTPADLTYDGTYASFTATDFTGYALTAVPEPGTIVLLAAAILGFAAYIRRRQ
jgi:hypothetical protein